MKKILVTRRLLRLQSKYAGDSISFVSTITQLDILQPPFVRGLFLRVGQDKEVSRVCWHQ